MVSKVDGAVVASALFDPTDDHPIVHPVFHKVAEGRDVDLTASFPRVGDQRVAGSGVGSTWCFALAFPPIPANRLGVRVIPDLFTQNLASLPEAFDADGFDVVVLVGDGPVGGVAPHPGFDVPAFGGVVLTAGVDDHAVNSHCSGDFDSHPDGGEFSHAYDWHLFLSWWWKVDANLWRGIPCPLILYGRSGEKAVSRHVVCGDALVVLLFKFHEVSATVEAEKVSDSNDPIPIVLEELVQTREEIGIGRFPLDELIDQSAKTIIAGESENHCRFIFPKAADDSHRVVGNIKSRLAAFLADLVVGVGGSVCMPAAGAGL